jgi:hypothetical protein
MFSNFKRDLADLETKVKFKMNEIKYSYEYQEMKQDLSNAGKKIQSAFKDDLKSASNNAYNITKKVFTKKKLKTMLG